MKKLLFAVIPILTGVLLTFNIPCSSASSFLETEVVTGRITSIEDKTIELNNKKQYYPAGNIRSINVSVGSMVSVRFFVANEKMIYVELKSGSGGLEELPEPPKPHSTKEK